MDDLLLKYQSALTKYQRDVKMLPPDNLQLQRFRPTPTQSQVDNAINSVLAMSDAFKAWVMTRSYAYWQTVGRNWSYEDQDYAACLDLLRHLNAQTQPRLL